MQTITIAGHLAEDCELKSDKKGHKYLRFRVCCEDSDMAGKMVTTVYRCYTYNLAFKDLKAGDLVFLTGSLVLGIYNNKVALDVKVQNISKGYK